MPITAALMSTYLRADGFSVDHTPDPSEALKFASQTKYRVVITDLVMRGMTGLDLYREIRLHDHEVKVHDPALGIEREAPADGVI
jgi:DNA-binding response OmpR family regulator